MNLLNVRYRNIIIYLFFQPFRENSKKIMKRILNCWKVIDYLIFYLEYGTGAQFIK